MSSPFLSTHPEPRVYVLHENDDWVVPLRQAFDAIGTDYAEWHLRDGVIDLGAAPPEGVFYNRMSASSHTRGHRHAPELTAATLAWLTRHGRTVVNGERALALEVSKTAQYEALKAIDIPVPDTLAVVGRENIGAAVEQLGYPVILKHNRAGKGLGVKLLRSSEALDAHLAEPNFDESIDGITLVQRYVSAPTPCITRVEFIAGKFLYAVRVDTSGGFELCPADACAVDQAALACPAEGGLNKFEIVKNFDHPLIPKWESFLAANHIDIAGIEFIVDDEGNAFTYDVNTNTNYNQEAEDKYDRKGMATIARYLTDLLAAQSVAVSAAA